MTQQRHTNPGRKWPRMIADEGCFWATDEHRDHRGKTTAASQPVCVFAARVVVAGSRGTGPLTPDPSPPFRGRGEDFVFLRCSGNRA